jgi:CheY-like chemotaxis protein
MTQNDKRTTILLVDDVPANIKSLMQILAGDHKVLFAKDGPKALKVARSQAVDLILLDVVMPDMDGYEVCSALKSSEDTSDIPVIFLTSQNESHEQAKGLALGAVDFITKPADPADVIARVNSHLIL